MEKHLLNSHKSSSFHFKGTLMEDKVSRKKFLKLKQRKSSDIKISQKYFLQFQELAISSETLLSMISRDF